MKLCHQPHTKMHHSKHSVPHKTEAMTILLLFNVLFNIKNEGNHASLSSEKRNNYKT